MKLYEILDFIKNCNSFTCNEHLHARYYLKHIICLNPCHYHNNPLSLSILLIDTLIASLSWKSTLMYNVSNLANISQFENSVVRIQTQAEPYKLYYSALALVILCNKQSQSPMLAATNIHFSGLWIFRLAAVWLISTRLIWS